MAVILGNGNITYSNGTVQSAPGIGENVQPIDVYFSRNFNTIYYNNSSRLLFVCINCSASVGTNSFQVNGIELAQNAGNGTSWNIGLIVPPGQSYQYYAPSGTPTIYRWTECF